MKIWMVAALGIIMSGAVFAAAQADETESQADAEYSPETLSRFQQASSETPEMPDAIRQLVSRGAQARYLGFYEGMHGWMTIQQGRPAFYYATPNGNALVRGFMFNAKGEMVTGEQITKLKMREGAQMMALSDIDTSEAAQQQPLTPESVNEAGVPNLSPIAAPEGEEETDTQALFVQSIENANGFVIGQADQPRINAFIDPDCDHCRTFLRAIKPYLDQGFVSLRVIPVGFEIGARQRAAYLLAAGNPAERLYDYIGGDRDALRPISRVAEDGLMQNIQLMGTWRLDATPIIIYTDSTGAPKIIRGIPKDTQSLVSDVIKG